MKSAPQGKSTALVAYAPFVGFLIAYSLNQEHKHPFATWHIKNMFGLTLGFIIAMVIQSQVHIVAGDVLWLIVLLLWIISFIYAFLNKEKGIPLLSKKFQDWFTFLN